MRTPIPPDPSAARVASLLENLRVAFTRFDQRWDKFLAEIDLTPVNRARDGYNRYYLLEKECAVRSEKTARAGFEPLPMVATDDLRKLFPPLPVIGAERAGGA